MWPFTRAASLAQAAPPSPVTSEAVRGASLDLDRFARDIGAEYTRNLFIWRCVDSISSLASSVPLKIVKPEDAQLSRGEMNVADLLARPNPQWAMPSLLYFVAASLAVSNHRFLKIARGIGDAPVELWPLGAEEVTVVYHQNSRLIDYFQMNGSDGRLQKHYVDADGHSDIVFIRRPSLNRQTDVSPAAVAAPSAETFNLILQRAADIADNSSNINGVLAADIPSSLQEIKDRLAQFKTGGRQSGGMLVTANAKWTLTKLTEDPSAALSVDIKNSLARDICACFGVPIQLMGLPGSETAYNSTV